PNHALLSRIAAAALLLVLGAAYAQQQEAVSSSSQTAVSAPVTPTETDKSDQTPMEITVSARSRFPHHHHGSQDNEIVSIGENSTLEAGKRADSVVAILGDATSAGDVSNAVVAILGDTHVTGPV